MGTYTIQNILVPVDLSETSLNAAEFAGTLAQATGAAIHLLSIEEPLQQMAEAFSTTATTSLVSQKDIFSALAASLRGRYRIGVHVASAEGSVPETILKSGRAMEADLIVMGAHGASGVRDGFMGHNTYHTLKYSTTPVLVVPKAPQAELFSHVIYPFRLVAGAQMLYDLVLPFIGTGATIELLSISQKMMDTGNRALQQFSVEVMQMCAGKNVTVKMAQGTSQRIGKELVQYASRQEQALVVINSALDVSGNPFFIGPHAQTVLNCLHMPMLVIPSVMEQSIAAQQAFFYAKQADQHPSL